MNFTMKVTTYKAVPEWARFMTLEEFRLFIKTIESELRKRRLPFDDHVGVIHIHVPEGTIQCGLYNIALKCASVKTSAYAQEVKAHFDRILADFEREPGPMPESFDEVREYVRVRIYTNAFVAESKAEVISRQITPDLQALVVYDLGAAAASMSPDQAKHWKLSPEEVFRIAIENTSKEWWSRTSFDLMRGEAFALVDMEGYGASHVLEVEEQVPVTTHGVVVALPCRQILICYPIVPATLLDALIELTVRVDAMYSDPLGDEGDELSPDLFWWRNGKLQSLGAGVNRRGLKGSVIEPPEEFVETVMVEAMRVAAIQRPSKAPSVAKKRSTTRRRK